MQLEIAENHEWNAPESPPAYLWVDARGVPPRYAGLLACMLSHSVADDCLHLDRCAAVLCIDGEHHYTDGPPAAKLMESFQKRCDNQITTLEILAISVGLSTFCDKLSGRKVVIFGDNTGAEASVRKGASRAWDQCQLIHEIWTLVLYQLCLCSFGNQ